MSEKIKAAPAAQRPTAATANGRLVPKRAKTRQAASAEQKKVQAPKYKVEVTMVGVAPTGQEVSRYLAQLNDYSLLTDVTLEYTEEKEIEGSVMQQFKINAKLDPAADVREIEPLILPRRLRDPMTDQGSIRSNASARGTVLGGLKRVLGE